MSLIRVKQIESGELFAFVEDVFSGEIGSLSSDVSYLLTYSSGISGNVDTLSSQFNILSGDVIDLTNTLTGFESKFDTLSGDLQSLTVDLGNLSGTVDFVSGFSETFSGLAQSAYDLSLETSSGLLNTGVSIELISGDLDSLSLVYETFSGALNLTGPQILGRESSSGISSGVGIGRGMEILGGNLQFKSNAAVGINMYQSSAKGSGSSEFIDDDTIPQSSEGFEIFSQAYTPVLSTSNILVEFDVMVGANAASTLGLALFESAVADAQTAKLQYIPASGSCEQMSLNYLYSNVTSGAKTFSVRMGALSAVSGFYNTTLPATFSTSTLMTMKITETAP